MTDVQHYLGIMRKGRLVHADGWMALVVREKGASWVQAPDETTLVVVGYMRKRRTGRVLVAREIHIQDSLA